MKIKILSVVKRPWWQRILTVNHWRVTAEDENGTQYTFNAWANVGNPNTVSLNYSIRNHFRTHGGTSLSEAEGRTIVV